MGNGSSTPATGPTYWESVRAAQQQSANSGHS